MFFFVFDFILYCFFFFFFQAEDGIRDWSVTVVQTCALPISILERMSDERRRDAALAKERFFERQDNREPSHRGQLPHPTGRPGPHLGSDVIERSEERRVGKECR